MWVCTNGDSPSFNIRFILSQEMIQEWRLFIIPRHQSCMGYWKNYVRPFLKWPTAIWSHIYSFLHTGHNLRIKAFLCRIFKIPRLFILCGPHRAYILKLLQWAKGDKCIWNLENWRSEILNPYIISYEKVDLFLTKLISVFARSSLHCF